MLGTFVAKNVYIGIDILFKYLEGTMNETRKVVGTIKQVIGATFAIFIAIMLIYGINQPTLSIADIMTIIIFIVMEVFIVSLSYNSIKNRE